jgi:hypothetical protein
MQPHGARQLLLGSPERSTMLANHLSKPGQIPHQPSPHLPQQRRNDAAASIWSREHEPA